ncbi:hypothetical protein [Alkalimarinus alittae]|uniref:Transmembrane protein n=1 Tax=Alkalimarinus alittae TaxID=2961619 RepID=A0ABY6MX49_9ALTE|nr:hypothetical protein [Alkalimarinus alittae]UZE94403.1 hypothetical protein NKI27_09875 [Alkalimarinus alittae]
MSGVTGIIGKGQTEGSESARLYGIAEHERFHRRVQVMRSSESERDVMRKKRLQSQLQLCAITSVSVVSVLAWTVVKM